MNNVKLAFIIDDKVIPVGDNVKLTLNSGEIRYGALMDINMRYKSVSITIKDDKFPSEYYPLTIDFKFIKNIEKVEEES